MCVCVLIPINLTDNRIEKNVRISEREKEKGKTNKTHYLIWINRKDNIRKETREILKCQGEVQAACVAFCYTGVNFFACFFVVRCGFCFLKKKTKRRSYR